MFFETTSRRHWLIKLIEMLSLIAIAPMTSLSQRKRKRTMPVVRISRGSFAATDYEKVKIRLTTSQESLVPAIKKLNGLLHYYTGIDAVSNTMTNVSVWRSLADAKQMETLVPMLALAKDFTQMGVTFERPIINYETIWEI